MEHSGKAFRAAMRLILISVAVVVGVVVVGILAIFMGQAIVAIAPILAAFWVLFVVFTLCFFRDPEPRVPGEPKLVVSPAHGKVDVIGTTTEPLFMGGECQRLSIFLSVLDVHVQNAPLSGKVGLLKASEGEFLSALKPESATQNENVLLGIEVNDPPDKRIGVRLIAGVLARRIVPFIEQGQEIKRGQRISLIQFGSRADVYLPANAKIKVSLGQHVVGGETVLAVFE